MGKFNKLDKGDKTERDGGIVSQYDRSGFRAAISRADVLIARLEARVAALEDELTSQESRRPDPNADKEQKQKDSKEKGHWRWAIVRERDNVTSVFSREHGFCRVIPGTHITCSEPALFNSYAEANTIVQALDLEGLRVSEGARVCAGLFYQKKDGTLGFDKSGWRE